MNFAKQMRALAEAHLESLSLNKFFEIQVTIRDQAEKGYFSCRHSGNLPSSVVEKLTSEGFTVTEHPEYTPSLYIVSW